MDQAEIELAKAQRKIKVLESKLQAMDGLFVLTRREIEKNRHLKTATAHATQALKILLSAANGRRELFLKLDWRELPWIENWARPAIENSAGQEILSALQHYAQPANWQKQQSCGCVTLSSHYETPWKPAQDVLDVPIQEQVESLETHVKQMNSYLVPKQCPNEV